MLTLPSFAAVPLSWIDATITWLSVLSHVSNVRINQDAHYPAQAH